MLGLDAYGGGSSSDDEQEQPQPQPQPQPQAQAQAQAQAGDGGEQARVCVERGAVTPGEREDAEPSRRDVDAPDTAPDTTPAPAPAPAPPPPGARDADSLPPAPEGAAPEALCARMRDFVDKTRSGLELTAQLRSKKGYKVRS